MIRVAEHSEKTFVVTMDKAEFGIVGEIARGYSIPKHDALTAVIYKGLDVVSRQLQSIEEAAKSEPEQPEDDALGVG